MEEKKIYHYVKPAGINVEELSEEIEEKDYVVAAVLESIVQRQHWKNQNRKNDTHENLYVNVSTKMLGDIHWRAPTVICKLKKQKKVFCDDCYVVGHKSLAYRFRYADMENGLDTWTVNTDEIHHHAARSVREYKEGSSIETSDELEAVIAPSVDFKMDSDVMSDSQVSDTNISVIMDVLNNKRIFKQRGVANRVYTSVSSLPKFARSYIYTDRYDDFSEIDLSSSQPFLFAGFVNLLLNENRESLNVLLDNNEQLVNLVLSWVSETGHNTSSFSSNVLYQGKKNKNKKTKQDLKEELDQFVKIVTEGDIYIDALQRLQPCYKTPLERDDMKKRVLILFNESNEKLNSNTYIKNGRRFENRLRYLEASYRDWFPLLWGLLERLRALSRAKYDTSAGDFLNRIESHVMVHEVANDINRKGQHPAFTIHDCLMVPSEIAEQTNNEIKEAFQSFLGIKPRTTIEQLQEQKSYKNQNESRQRSRSNPVHA